jgi:predicted PurR-regulated permease PerM
MSLKEILIPVTIALFLTFLFHPLLLIFRRYGIPKWITIFLIFLLIAGLNYLFGLLLLYNLETISGKLQYYLHNLTIIVQNLLKPLGITVKEFSKIIGFDLLRVDGESLFKKLYELGVVEWFFTSTISFFGDMFISLFFWIFMMAGKRKFEERLKSAFLEKKEIIAANIEAIDNQLQSYLVVKTVLSLLTGLFSWGVLALYDVDFALFWGILTFILNYIPNIGSTVATLAPVSIAILDKGLGWPVIIMTILLLLVHNLIGNILEPHYMGKQMDLSPVFVLFSLIFWGWVWGIVGMFLAVPIAAAMKIFFSNIPPLKPISIILGSKPMPLVIQEPALEQMNDKL